MPETDDAETDATDDEAAAPADAAPTARRRRGLDGRTIAVCVLVAFIAAAVTYLAVSALTGDDGDDTAVDGDPTELVSEAETVPSVALERFDGSGVSPADYLGTPLVMNFWASWCTPCIEEMPDLQEVHETLGEDVAFLGVNVRDTEESGRAMIERTGVTYDIGRDTSGDLARELDIVTLPVTVIVGPDGTILQTLHGQVSQERLCEALNTTVGSGECT